MGPDVIMVGPEYLFCQHAQYDVVEFHFNRDGVTRYNRCGACSILEGTWQPNNLSPR